MVFAVTRNNKSKIYTDIMERFIILSRDRTRFIFICNDKYRNAILVTPLKNHYYIIMIMAYNKIPAKDGFKSESQVLDNEISTEMKGK